MGGRESPAPANPQATVATVLERKNVGAQYVNGLRENIAGMLAYFVIPAIVFLWVRPFKTNRFVRFHSFQCLAVVGMLIGAHVLLVFVAKLLPLFALPLFGLLVLGEITLWLLLLVKAYQHEVFKLPIVGKVAASFARQS